MAKTAGSLEFAVSEFLMPKQLLKLEQKLQNLDLLCASIGQKLSDSTKERMTRQETPDGGSWEALDPNYELRRKAIWGDRPILDLSGFLFESIAYESNAKEIRVGSSAIYAGTHQYGLPQKNVPARPYLGLSEEDKSTITNLFSAFLEL